MPAITDNFTLVAVAGSETTVASPGKAVGASSLSLTSAAGWPTTTAVVFALRRVDTNGNEVPGTYTEWIGTLSGTTISGLTGTPLYGSDQVYAADGLSQAYIPLSAARENRIINAILSQHNQDGSHHGLTTDTLSVGTSAILPSGSIIPSNLTSGAPSSWPWQSDTPTITGITVGNGTVTAAHMQVGKRVDYRVLLTFGSTTTLPTSADSFISLPVTARASIYPRLANIGTLVQQVATQFFQGYAGFSDVNTIQLQSYAISGAVIRTGAVDTNNFGSPGSGDTLFIQGSYEAA